MPKKVKEHAMIVLAIEVEPRHVRMVEHILATLRAGLAEPVVWSTSGAGWTQEKPLAWGWEGPFTVLPGDAEIIHALADEYEGHDEGAESDREPHIIRGRHIRELARAAVAGCPHGA